MITKGRGKANENSEGNRQIEEVRKCEEGCSVLGAQCSVKKVQKVQKVQKVRKCESAKGVKV
ncbi:MAG: hypothetical protein A2Y07_04870 [Planctomycetes bacterium GWF2_50_10]|nr:MAG: hypothetical protein A2Y07_04870 [Planctomycetes bacterium GWF2_50_10]